MRVAIRKLPGVESVDVSLERGAAEIRLRSDNRVTVPQLRKIIRDTDPGTPPLLNRSHED